MTPVDLPHARRHVIAERLSAGQAVVAADLAVEFHLSEDAIRRDLRALAVTTARRSSALPDVPTLEEAGPKGFDIGTWFGVLAPAATPKDIVSKLNTEMVKALRAPEFRRRMEEIGAQATGGTSEQLASQIRNETGKFARLVKEANVQIE